ncbi:MAG: hypothetical protein GY953_42790, partial [bacterium]|nr:hypothetical protein [bacterium]
MRILAFLVLFLTSAALSAQELSRSFELRYFTSDPAANGETDFKGPTAIFDTDQRVEYLRQYARHARSFHQDPRWDTLVVTEAEARQALARIKPQPLPAVRRRIPLEKWKWHGSRNGQRAEEKHELAGWKKMPGVEVADGRLIVIEDNTQITKPLPAQSWRLLFQWRAKAPVTNQRITFSLSNAVQVGFGGDGRLFPAGSYQPGAWVEFNVEIDFESGCYNFYADGKLEADFAPLLASGPVTEWKVSGAKGLALDDIWGVEYTRSEITDDIHTRDVPYSIHTFIDEDFEVRPDITGWTGADYDDTAWKPATLPYAHGGERHAGEHLYLRKRVRVGEFERAVLELEALDPAGEIWVNGDVVSVRPNRHPGRVDITSFLKPNQENLIAVRVRPNYAHAT